MLRNTVFTLIALLPGIAPAFAGSIDAPTQASPEQVSAYNAMLESLDQRSSKKAGIIPHGRLAEGDGLSSWFAGATDRYAHGVLGDSLEAGELVVESDGATHRFTLPRRQVFEDLEPRIVDLDQDGLPEILAIRADFAEGAAPVLYGVRDGELIRLAEGAAIGRSNRWLNPAGVADFDGDGDLEIAVIRTPHIGGILIHYGWGGGATLVEERWVRGFSTHRIGSTVLDLSFISDWDGDGVADLILPLQPRNQLMVVTAEGGSFVELARGFAHSSEIIGPLRQIEGELVYQTGDGQHWSVTLPETGS